MNAEEELTRIAEARKKLEVEERNAKEQQRIEKAIEEKIPKEDREKWGKVKELLESLSEKTREAKKKKVEIEGKISEKLTDDEATLLFGAVKKKKSNGEPREGTKNDEVLGLIRGGMLITKDLNNATGRDVHGQIYALLKNGSIENIGPGKHKAV